MHYFHGDQNGKIFFNKWKVIKVFFFIFFIVFIEKKPFQFY
jgi:hypothetical protein